MALIVLFILPAAFVRNACPAPVISCRVVGTYPHDRKSFTQGLFFEDGILYEGTGLHGESALRKIKLESGAVLKTIKLPQEFFGEGITALGNRIIQLTWRSHTAFVYDKDSFRLLDKFEYPSEGWGITYTGRHLVMSDGTENLYFLDPETFREIRRVRVFDDRGFVIRLNELEYVRGEIYANVWPTNRIAKIDPKTGRVTEWINLDGLQPVDDYDSRKVLNGIAYDEKGDRLFVTGKLWPYVYEIVPVPEE